MISGRLSFRAGVRTGRLAASLPRIGCSLRLAHFRWRIVLRLIVLTVHVFNVVRRIVVRERADSAVLSTLPKGSICVAIWWAVAGITPRGITPGNATPERCAVAAVDAITDWMCLFLDGCDPSIIRSSQSRMACFAETLCCIGNQACVTTPFPPPRSEGLRVFPMVGGVFPVRCSGSSPR